MLIVDSGIVYIVVRCDCCTGSVRFEWTPSRFVWCGRGHWTPHHLHVGIG